MLTTPLSRNRLTALLLSAIPLCSLAEGKTSSLKELLSGNTLLITNKYAASPIHFRNDGACTVIGAGTGPIHCTWRISGDDLCSTITDLPPGREPREFCMKIEQRHFNSSWTAEDPRNGTIKYTILKGHVTP